VIIRSFDIRHAAAQSGRVPIKEKTVATMITGGDTAPKRPAALLEELHDT
jgi:hypothetical protein